MKHRSRGMARIFGILIAAIVVMLLVIGIPIYHNMQQSARREMDDWHEQAAWESALMQAMGVKDYVGIYDGVNKQFVPVEEVRTVPAYGACSEHEGMVILVKTNAGGSVYLYWTDPKHPLENPEPIVIRWGSEA